MNVLLREVCYRIGRRLYAEARGDVNNDAKSNGEYALLDKVIKLIQHGEQAPVFVDVGANLGDWSWTALRLATAQGIKPTIHAIEPSSTTFKRLGERFAARTDVAIHRLAMAGADGTANLRVDGPLAGTNSLSARGDGAREAVDVATFDSFCATNAIDRVCMVKTDTEGFDFSVMRGALRSFEERRVGLWQFEYNHRWLDDRAYLRDAFDLADAVGYLVGRVMRGGNVELYEAWNPELERFFEANYCLVPRGGAAEALCEKFRFGRGNAPTMVTGGG